MASKKQTKDPLDGLNSYKQIAFGHLLEGYRALVNMVEADLKSHSNLGISEAEVLIRLANSDGYSMQPGELAQQCVMSPSGCTRLLDRLEEQELITRATQIEDRRAVVIKLTDQGLETLRRMLPSHYESLEAHMWSKLTADELKTLSKLMAKLRD